MFKFVSSIGDAAYKAASKTGLAAGSEQPPYPCALPLQVIEDCEDTETTERVLNDTYAAVRDLLSDDLPLLHSTISDVQAHKPFKLVDFTDREGDIRLFTRPHVGSYNFARVTLTLDNVSPAKVLTFMHAQSLEARNRYSSNLCQYDVIARNPELPAQYIGNDNDHLEELCRMGIRDWHVEYNRYSAPPPVTARDFVYLVEKRYAPEQRCYYIYGTSVDYRDTAGIAIEKDNCVRGAVVFGWRFQHVGRKTYCTYVSCMSPNGWAPTFIVGWMKTAIAKELQNARRVLYQDVPSCHAAGASSEYAKGALAAYDAPITSCRQNKPTRDHSSSKSSAQKLGNAMEHEERRLLEDEKPIVFE
ncbi:conserved hypothetical protein [Leishmania major strain Friedlin]|uniref:START domain-containing protein n=1 Tax=Leishmania major TaxID=5664 RepID=Q4Q3H6_LEIMA|nr:conserved hypothetical protein [Leishmania major strain Friedlin]CAG9581767.1 hypothetical_protein_-_conserved [Leishmania major strain Friedlin]CAJ07733.1 conserved hypothetical protein [Leishmania major strain Friedlin]|eukprot:XP_001686122.1 conserved hypothetical protein [Leishmania major strain Friedlin]